MRLRASVILVAIVCTIHPVLAQRSTAPCEDHDPDRRLCGPAEERRLLDLYGLKPIAEHRAANDEVRRAFFWDGFGGDVFAISFVHARGQDPKVSVAFPKRSGQPPWNLDAVVPQRTWDDVLRRSRFFDRALVELPESKVTSICVDPPSALVESTDSPDAPFDSGLRRQHGDSCRDGLAFSYAYELITTAVPLFAVCQSLGSDRGWWATLEVCGKLRGDRMVAAEVMRLTDDFVFDLLRRSSEIIPESPQGLNLADDATIDWAGTHSEPGQAATFWLAHTGAQQFVHIAVDLAVGESARTARVVGILTHRSKDSDGVKFEVAPIEMQWTRDGLTGIFSLRRIVVGTFKPETDK